MNERQSIDMLQNLLEAISKQLRTFRKKAKKYPEDKELFDDTIADLEKQEAKIKRRITILNNSFAVLVSCF